jgi:hypothetical protein
MSFPPTPLAVTVLIMARMLMTIARSADTPLALGLTQ